MGPSSAGQQTQQTIGQNLVERERERERERGVEEGRNRGCRSGSKILAKEVLCYRNVCAQ